MSTFQGREQEQTKPEDKNLTYLGDNARQEQRKAFKGMPLPDHTTTGSFVSVTPTRRSRTTIFRDVL